MTRPDLPPPRPADAISIEEIHQIEEAHSLWDDAWHRLAQNKAAMAGLVFFVAVTVVCLVGPFFTGYRYEETALSIANTPPLADIIEVDRLRDGALERSEFTTLDRAADRYIQATGSSAADFKQRLEAGETVTAGDRRYRETDRLHLIGTDNLGRDLLTRLFHGGRISIAVGFLATLVSIFIGVIYGSIAGFLGGRTDAVMMRLVDILYAMPFTIFVILLMVFFGREIWLMFLAIGAVVWLTMARIVRGQVVSIRQQEYIEAAIAIGQKHRTIIFRHVIPNVLGPVIVYSTLTIPSVILFESFLSFLGLGVQPPMASWGVLIKEGAESMTVFPWQLFFPAILFSLTLLAMNFLGDGLRDALDPKTAR